MPLDYFHDHPERAYADSSALSYIGHGSVSPIALRRVMVSAFALRAMSETVTRPTSSAERAAPKASGSVQAARRRSTTEAARKSVQAARSIL
jgi:hypothetical protein